MNQIDAKRKRLIKKISDQVKRFKFQSKSEQNEAKRFKKGPENFNFKAETFGLSPN